MSRTNFEREITSTKFMSNLGINKKGITQALGAAISPKLTGKFEGCEDCGLRKA